MRLSGSSHFRNTFWCASGSSDVGEDSSKTSPIGNDILDHHNNDRFVWPIGQDLTDMKKQDIQNAEKNINDVDDISKPSQESFEDVLLDALVSLTRFHHKPCTAESLIAGLPLESGKLNPDLFVRAAERAGFLSKHAEISISDISKRVLPVVLSLKNNKAVLLLDVREDHALILETGT
ncbi:MAG: hypothetical protein ACI9CE_003988, partial [Flavobacterium sp.]